MKRHSERGGERLSNGRDEGGKALIPSSKAKQKKKREELGHMGKEDHGKVLLESTKKKLKGNGRRRL